MFIKKVTKNNGRSEKPYEYLHLVESVRTPQGPRQRLILNLGNLELHPSQYKSLARRIEDLLTGQKSFFELNERIEKQAQWAAKRLFKKRASEVTEAQTPEYKTIDIHSLDAADCRSIGPEYLCHQVWKELKLDAFLEQEGVSKHILPLMETLVVGRLVSPGSERHTRTWAEKRSAIFELCGEPLRKSLKSYYRVGDRLYALKEKIEQYLRTWEKDLFSLSEKMIFLDLTNTYFEGQSLKNPKAQFGRSKEKRSDCKLVTLGLMIDAAGFAKHSQLFVGNQAESDTLSQMIEKMSGPQSASQEKQTIIIDAGFATEKNITWLKENHYSYIAVHRARSKPSGEGTDWEVIREGGAQGVKIEVKRFEAEGEIHILCKSERKEAKERGMRHRVEKLFLNRLKYYQEGLTLPRKTKKYKKIIEQIGRLKEKYPKAGKLYTVEVIPEEGKTADDPSLQAIEIRYRKKAEVYKNETSKEGKYLLRTDRDDLTNKEIWETYVMLTRIENSFRCLKSSLGLRPNFHQKEDRVDAHMFISVLAYHILHIIEYRLHQRGYHSSWETIRNILSTHERVTISYQVKDAKDHSHKEFVRVNSNLEPEHKEIYKKFNVSDVPLPRKHMTEDMINR